MRALTWLILSTLTFSACGGSSQSIPEARAGGEAGGGAAGSAAGSAASGAGGAVAGGSAGGSGASGGSASGGGTGGAPGAAGRGGAGNSSGASGGGSGGAAQGGAGGSGAGATMAQVQAIFDDHCINCHDKSKMGLPTFGALSLVAGDAHDALVGKAATETCGGTYVVPGDPDHSYLVAKLTQSTPCEGQKMPRPFEIIKPAPLTSEQLATVRAWIAAGAPR